MKAFFKSSRMAKQEGMALAVILFLIAILSATGLAFLHKVGTGASATAARGAGMQAQYLAESAVNHAMWRLLNEPGFPAAENVYYMHDLGNDRYGYKVRRPTGTTFAAVATVGATSDSVVNQSYVQYIAPEMMIVYGDTSGNSHPYRRMVGASFDPSNPTFNIGNSEATWVTLKGHPFKNEFVAGFTDSQSDVELGVWNGSSWGNTLKFIDHSKKDYKLFDIAYDSYNGHALALGYDINAPGSVMHTIWNQTAWTSPAQAFITDAGLPIWHIQAEGSHLNGEILITVVDDDDDIMLYRWDGATFLKLTTLETDAANKKPWVVNMTYEQQSGEALIVWGKAASNGGRYAVWDGSTISSLGSVPFSSSPTHMVRLAADPTSNTIFLIALTENNKIYAAVWDGTNWTDSRELETSADQGSEYLNFDAAWEGSGNEVIAAWGRSGSTQARYLRWSKGSALSSAAVEIGPDFQDNLRAMRMRPVPGSDRIVMASNNKSKDLRYCLWDGERFVGDPPVRLTAKQPAEKWLAHDMAIPNYLPGPTVAPTPNAQIELGYVERYDDWQIGASGSWQVQDLSGAPFLVPANAVLEVAVTNPVGNRERWGGIRAVGSTLERWLLLHEAEAGGVNALVMHVQADANSRIECYAEDKNDIQFVLLGFWTKGTYVERWNQFNANTAGTWEDRSLAPFSVGADQVAEMVIANKNGSFDYHGGVRRDGSSLDRKLHLQEAEAGGVDKATMMVMAGSTASAPVEVYAEEKDNIDFYLAGYWSDPPGTFVEDFANIGSPVADKTWEDKFLTGFGVPARSVVQIALSNRDINEENNMGVRRQGSSLSRFINLHEAEDGGDDLAVMHVTTSDAAAIQWYHNDVSDSHEYRLCGYWDLEGGPLPPAPPPPPPCVAVEVDAVSTSPGGDKKVETWTHTVTASGADRIIVVGVAFQEVPDKGVDKVTYGGQTLTRAGRVNRGSDAGSEIFYLTDPPTGNNTVKVTMKEKVKLRCGAISFLNVNQATPYGVFYSDTGLSKTPELNIAGVNHCRVVFDHIAVKNYPSATAGANQIRRWHAVSPSDIRTAASTEKAPVGGGTVTMSWTLSEPKEWALGAIDLQPAE
jgi:hypothetical protein